MHPVWYEPQFVAAVTEWAWLQMGIFFFLGELSELCESAPLQKALLHNHLQLEGTG